MLQRLGINPDQISFSARIALLPLVNDPAAIEQYVQGLPAKTAVLNPATSQAVAFDIVKPVRAVAGHRDLKLEFLCFAHGGQPDGDPR